MEKPQDSDIRHLIEECSIKFNFRVIRKSSTFLKDTSQISPVHAVAPILSTKEPEYLPSMVYEHSNTTLEIESDEIIKSGVEELIPILSEDEVTLKDKRECDMPVCEDSSTSDLCDNHSDIFPDSKIDDISEEEVDLEDISQIQDVVLRKKLLSITRLIANIESLNDNPIPYRELNSSVSVPIFEESDNSLSDNFLLEFETFCDHTKETKTDNTTTHADDSLPEYDSFCFEMDPDQERLINVLKNDISNNSSSDPLLEEADLFLASDNSIPPGIENFADNSEGDICFLEELLIDDSILSHESSNSNFEDNPSVPLPPPKPPDEEFNFGDEISIVIDEFECIDARVNFDVSNDKNDDYSYFMIAKVFSFLSIGSEDTIFDPGISN
uniref:Reverse transcriptase domain-containing protein n=1 Tax=Tanacetum cinerariifolium TaxID=118510 RepID=A0A6L2MV47_TANCI|nr:hypothetical protein [Tanacetum cinerariifolium]